MMPSADDLRNFADEYERQQAVDETRLSSIEQILSTAEGRIAALEGVSADVAAIRTDLVALASRVAALESGPSPEPRPADLVFDSKLDDWFDFFEPYDPRIGDAIVTGIISDE